MIQGNHKEQVDKGLLLNNVFLFHHDYYDDKMISFCRSLGSEGRFSKLKSIRILLEDEDESCIGNESCTGDESCIRDESLVCGFLFKYLSIILAKE